jgi:hypothetical protein
MDLISSISSHLLKPKDVKKKKDASAGRVVGPGLAVPDR